MALTKHSNFASAATTGGPTDEAADAASRVDEDVEGRTEGADVSTDDVGVGFESRVGEEVADAVDGSDERVGASTRLLEG